jgi:DNA-binding response OmpR family regulator
MSVCILVIQEAEASSQGLLQLTETEGYQVHTAELEHAQNHLFMVPPDIVALNLRHLGPETRPLCQAICQQTRNLMLPLMLLTESCDEMGLPREPEGCLVMPLPAHQIATAIRIVSRNHEAHILAADGLRLDLDSHRVVGTGSSHHLSPRELRLLETFLRHPMRVLTRRFLMREVWDTDFVEDTRTLDVHIHWIRRKIEPDPSRPRYLRTVRGVGYYFTPVPPETRSTGA